MSKAFDCVVHDILLSQLDNIGVRGHVLELFKNYLRDRQQATVIVDYDKKQKTLDSVQSQFEITNIGVPQGSVLGPLLFLIYVNELPYVVEELCVMFADDATILFTGEKFNISQMEYNINQTLRKVVSWLKTINLTVNLNKTNVIQFRNYKTDSVPLNIVEAGTSLQQVDSARFLGVTIDTFLNWKAHVAKINKIISSQCYALSILSSTCSEDVSRSSYFGNVYPQLTYGIIFWGNSVNVHSTFVLQKRCLRTIYRLPANQSLRNVFKQKRYLTLTGIYILELSLFVKNNDNYFTKKSSFKLNLREKYKYNLVRPKSNNSLYYKSAFMTAIRVFNALPNEIKMLDGNSFKNKLKNWLMDNVFYNVNEFFSNAACSNN